MKASVFAVSAWLALAGCASAQTYEQHLAEMTPDQVSNAIAGAIDDPSRGTEAMALDEGRKPFETLTFLGLQPGVVDAADIFTGSGYWAQIMARVVGPKGTVVAFEPAQFYEGKGKEELDAAMAGPFNARVQPFPFESFTAPASSIDFAMINLNYHDVYWVSERFKIGRQEPDAFTRNLFAAMRPGGIVGVIDHAGPAGDTRAIVDKTHRIDPAVVKADFERAGFVLEAESDLLRNPKDDYSVNVFDAAVRGKTDRFLFKFRKPG